MHVLGLLSFQFPLCSGIMLITNVLSVFTCWGLVLSHHLEVRSAVLNTCPRTAVLTAHGLNGQIVIHVLFVVCSVPVL